MHSHQQSWRPPPPCQTGSIHLLQFLNPLHDNILQQEGEPGQPEQVQYVVIWDNVSFHHAALVHPWFNAHPRFTVLFLPAYSLFLNPIEELFSAWRWKVYDHNPYLQQNLLEAMLDPCGDVSVESIQGYIRHTRAFSTLPRKSKHNV